MKFKPGDKVRCVDRTLDPAVIFEVVGHTEGSNLLALKNHAYHYFEHRFEKVLPRKLTLKDLL